MNYEKYLPIGTVVMLKEGKKRVMITGFLTTTKEEKEKTYDYSGCLYPEGVITSDKTLVFNHDQIKEVYYVGLIDDEEKEFKEKLKNLLSTMSNNNDNQVSQNTTQVNNNFTNNISNYKQDTVEDIEFEDLT